MSIVHIAPIETITSPPGFKLFYYAEMSQLREAVDSNGLPQHTQFPYAPAIFSRFDNYYSYVAFGKIHFIPKLLPVQNVVFDLRVFQRLGGRGYDDSVPEDGTKTSPSGDKTT